MSLTLMFAGNNCGWPPVPLDANITTYTAAGQREVSYWCNSPFKLASYNRRSSQCDPRTGLWTKLPECTCPTSQLPHYVEIIQIRNHSLKYQCKLPRIGHGTILCDLNSGKWPSQSLCSCPEHGFSYIQSTLQNAYTLSYQCKSELNLTGSGQMSCDFWTGKWSHPDCSCQEPTLPTFAKLLYEHHHVMHYECTGPFVGKGSLTCNLSTGVWSTVTVNCKCRHFFEKL
jgi:hypothetical protein